MPRKHDPINLAGALGLAALAIAPFAATGFALAWLRSLFM